MSLGDSGGLEGNSGSLWGNSGGRGSWGRISAIDTNRGGDLNACWIILHFFRHMQSTDLFFFKIIFLYFIFRKAIREKSS